MEPLWRNLSESERQRWTPVGCHRDECAAAQHGLRYRFPWNANILRYHNRIPDFLNHSHPVRRQNPPGATFFKFFLRHGPGSSKHAALDLDYLQKTDFISEYIKVSRIYSDPEGILRRPMEPTGQNHQLPTVSLTLGGEEELLGRA